MIRYEWVIETIDEHEDIIDVDHANIFAQANKKADLSRAEGKTIEVALVRDRINDVDEDLDDRQWAYLKDGKLPERFDGGAAVPKKYAQEVRLNA